MNCVPEHAFHKGIADDKDGRVKGNSSESYGCALFIAP